MNTVKQRIKYMVGDLIATAIGWCCFYVYRFDVTGHLEFETLQDFLTSHDVMLNLCITPLLWLLLYWFSGYYNKPFFKNLLDELQKTFMSVLLGSLLFFFLYVIDDVPLFEYNALELTNSAHVPSSTYVQILLTMFSIIFVPVYVLRLVISRKADKKIENGELALKTMIVGSPRVANILQRELNEAKHKSGYSIEDNIEAKDADAFILAPEVRVAKSIFRNVYELLPYEKPILLKAEAEDMLYGQVHTKSIRRIPMIEYGNAELPPFKNNVKRLFDIAISIICLILLSPVMLIIAILIKKDSVGSVIYKQERLGKCAKPFVIYKFRTMTENAEPQHPMLSAKEDPRITKIGRFLRKYRLDEVPQFWNVLKGDMSLVGPRPERKYYADQLVEIAPQFVKLLQVKPGITSWGLVKYGYASNTFQMVERMRYDMMYLDNRSLGLDLKIIGYTIKIVVTGKGI